jgi:hypothetical protein
MCVLDRSLPLFRPFIGSGVANAVKIQVCKS